MSAWKIIGVTGAVLAAAVGGYFAWRYFRNKRSSEKPERARDERDEPDEAAEPRDIRARSRYLSRDEIQKAMEAEIDAMFGDGWPPNEETIEQLQHDDVIVFAVESEPVGNFDQTRQEIVNANVLSVEDEVVRGRVISPVKHAEHHGAHAGHGVRIGDSVEVPHKNVLVAARRTDSKGYNSRGKAAQEFKPSNATGKTYEIKPGTPYDLVLPYRTPDLEWIVEPKLNVHFVQLGERGLLEQFMFGEATVRGPIKVTVLDHDENAGTVFVANWTFNLVD